MKTLKFNSQICTTIEQSKRLLELGLNPETADMCWFNVLQKPYCSPYKYFVEKAQDMKWIIYPAWSLHRLIELGGFNVEGEGLFWRVTGAYFSESCDKIYDTIIDSIEVLITDNLFNKKYLKQ